MTAMEAMYLRMQQQETTLVHFAAKNQQMTQRLALAFWASRASSQETA